MFIEDKYSSKQEAFNAGFEYGCAFASSDHAKRIRRIEETARVVLAGIMSGVAVHPELRKHDRRIYVFDALECGELLTEKIDLMIELDIKRRQEERDKVLAEK